MAPRLGRITDATLLTWLEPDERGHRLLVAQFDPARDAWGPPRTIATGDVFFANWADVPGVARDGEGGLVAHWLEKLGEATYAYGVRMARSGDAAASWEPMGLLHDDASPTEHGFVSYVTQPTGLRTFWLDGRAMERGGSMQLRTVRLGGGTPGASELLDDRVCECCATDAAMTSAGPLVVYRDRSAAEVRDIAYVVARERGFSEPALVHADGWRIGGCPVNGPAVDADGKQVYVAWFTGAEERPRVLAAFSRDAGTSFDPPIVVDDSRPLGRVDIVADGSGGAVVAWIATTQEGAQVRMQRLGPEGLRGTPRVVTMTTPTHSAGVPTLARQDGRLIVAWVEDARPTRLGAAVIAIGEL